MADKDPYIQTPHSEVESPLFKKIRVQYALYTVLKKWANWETGIATAAITFLAQPCGLSKTGAWKQLVKLKEAGVISYPKLPRRGRRTHIPDYTKIQVFDLYGKPLFSKFSKENINVLPGELNSSPGGTNTTIKSQQSTHNKGEKEGKAVGGTGGSGLNPNNGYLTADQKAAYAYLVGLGIIGRLLKRCTEALTLAECVNLWDQVNEYAKKRKVGSLTGLFQQLTEARIRQKTKFPQPLNPPHSPNGKSAKAEQPSLKADSRAAAPHTLEPPSPAAAAASQAFFEVQAKRKASRESRRAANPYSEMSK